MAIGPHGGVTVRFTTTPQGQGHRTVAAQVVADVLGVDPADVDVRADADTAANPWTVSSGNYSSRFAVVGASAVHRAAEQLSARPARHRGADPGGRRGRDRARRGPRPRGRRPRALGLAAAARRLRALGPGRPARRALEPGLAVTASFTLPLAAAGRRRPRQLVRHLRLHRRPRASSLVDPQTGEVEVRSLRHRPRRRPHPQPAHRRGPDPRRARARPRCGAARGAPLRRGRQPADRDLRRLPAADRDGAAARALRDRRVAVAADAARRQGPRRGQHDERARRDRQRRRRRASGATTSSCR